MAWYHAFRRRGPARPTAPIPPKPTHRPTIRALTAAAAPIATPRSELVRTPDTWQEEAWQYYQDLGEFRYATEWEARILSRVRFHAAKLEPGADEPVRAEAGTAVDLMTAFAGGPAGQASVMENLATQLAVPGEGYLIVENIDGIERWSVRSIDEVRVAHKHFEVIDENNPRTGTAGWRELATDSLRPLRVWRPNKRYHHLADSPARAARATMRELELVNRHIVAQYLSRLASAGVVVFPDEVTFPVREEFADAPDPFVEEWIESARTAISTPGTAAAVVPMPIKVPAEYVDKIAHIDFTLKIDDKIIEKRDSAIKRLASQLNVPPEVLLGMSDLNHWNAWISDENNLKVNTAPDAELISAALTTGYLQPRLRASGVQDWAQWVVWYDLSELTLRPDRSADALQLYDRLEINGDALRRETGFDEGDKPTPDELEEQALLILLREQPVNALTALARLLGDEAIPPAAAEPAAPAAQPEAPAPEERTPPDQPPPADRNATARARDERMAEQARARHAVRFSVGRPPELLHPKVCTQHAYSCPFTHAGRRLSEMPRPGTSGVYEARLDVFGQFRIGVPLPHLDTSGFLTTIAPPPREGVNGFAHSRG